MTGFLAGYLVLWIKKVKVPKFVQPIMPIIVIPIVATTSALGLFFIYVIGRPIAWVFENLTSWLGGMTGTSAALLGVILGLMIAFDMGGPVNKTAFLFGAGLVSQEPGGHGHVRGGHSGAAAGAGLATLIRRKLFYRPGARDRVRGALHGLLRHHRGRDPVRGGAARAGHPGEHARRRGRRCDRRAGGGRGQRAARRSHRGGARGGRRCADVLRRRRRRYGRDRV